MISSGELVVMAVAVGLVAEFFFVTRHYLRRAAAAVACEDGPADPEVKRADRGH